MHIQNWARNKKDELKRVYKYLVLNIQHYHWVIVEYQRTSQYGRIVYYLNSLCYLSFVCRRMNNLNFTRVNLLQHHHQPLYCNFYFLSYSLNIVHYPSCSKHLIWSLINPFLLRIRRSMFHSEIWMLHKVIYYIRRFTMRKPNLTDAISQFTQLSHSFRHEG